MELRNRGTQQCVSVKIINNIDHTRIQIQEKTNNNVTLSSIMLHNADCILDINWTIVVAQYLTINTAAILGRRYVRAEPSIT